MTTSAPDTLPELGPLLGGLVAAPIEQSAARARLEPARLELLTALFDKAGEARALLLAGDTAGARSRLGPATWLAAWEPAVSAATQSVSEEVERRLRDAAAVSRFPAKRLAAVFPDADERRRLAARLSAAGIGLEETVPLLEDPSRSWTEAVRRVSGELEAAWERLAATALEEVERWELRAVEIRTWRRPWLPLVLTGVALSALAAWLGLVLGGYLRAPLWLRPLTDWIWNR